MKYILEEINRINKEEEQISELEDSLVKITAMKQNKEKRMKRNEDGLRDLCCCCSVAKSCPIHWGHNSMHKHSHDSGPKRIRNRGRS